MVWSVFNYLLTQKLPRKAKVVLGCPQYKKLLKTLKVAQQLPRTIYLCLSAVSKAIPGGKMRTKHEIKIKANQGKFTVYK